MYDGSQGNAMTEIALALAMGFFSILVLTMVSMGAGDASQGEPNMLVAECIEGVWGFLSWADDRQ